VPLVHDSCADGEGDGLGLAVGAELAEDPFVYAFSVNGK
jgi:hypothetical protein